MKPEGLHIMDFGANGRVTMRVTFQEDEIVGALDIPPALNRKNRREVLRWIRRITRKLDRDERGMRLVTTCNGSVVAVGAEHGGHVASIRFPDGCI